MQATNQRQGLMSTYFRRNIDMATLTQITVPFHNAELYIVEHGGQPYTPLRQIVQGMGLDWASQFTKIKQKFATCVVEITMQVLGDDQARSHTCIPVRKLPAWLYSVNPNKVKPELRDTVIMYQNECDDVLWDYWTKGQAINQRKVITPEQQDALQVIVDQRAGDNRKIRAEMWSRHNRHFKIAKYNQLLAVHFEDAKNYLIEMQLQEKVDIDPLKRLDNFLKGLADRYPSLQNPIAYEIAQKISDSLSFQDINGRIVYWIAINQNKVAVQQMSVHHAPVNIVKLKEKFSQLHNYMISSEILEMADRLEKL